MNREFRGGTRTRAHSPCHSLLAPPAVASSTTFYPCPLWLLLSGSTTPKSSLRKSATRGFTQGTVTLAQSPHRVVGGTVLCGWFQPALTLQAARPSSPGPYLSMMTGSEGVSFRLPQLFRSQHRLKEGWGGREGGKKEREISVGCVCVHACVYVCVCGSGVRKLMSGLCVWNPWARRAHSQNPALGIRLARKPLSQRRAAPGRSRKGWNADHLLSLYPFNTYRKELQL